MSRTNANYLLLNFSEKFTYPQNNNFSCGAKYQGTRKLTWNIADSRMSSESLLIPSEKNSWRVLAQSLRPREVSAPNERAGDDVSSVTLVTLINSYYILFTLNEIMNEFCWVILSIYQ